MIIFFNEEIDFKAQKPLITKKWLKSVAKSEGFDIENLNYVFCSDKYLHQMNVDYLDHDTLTDIITFDNSEEESIIEGDIFISIERVKENAEKFQVNFEHELRRVMVHGVLHLCGYHDKSEAEQQEMRSKENENLAKFQELSK